MSSPVVVETREMKIFAKRAAESKNVPRRNGNMFLEYCYLFIFNEIDYGFPPHYVVIALEPNRLQKNVKKTRYNCNSSDNTF